MDFDIPKALLEAGGWVFAAITLTGVVTALIRGDLVPGNIHKREIARADTATSQLERWNEIGDTLTVQVKLIAELVADVLRPRAR